MTLQRRAFLAASSMSGMALILPHLTGCATPPRQAAGSPPATPESAVDDGRHDFDFYIGRWVVQARRLKKRFAGSDDWEEYAATDQSQPILGGLGLVDDFRTEHFGGDFRGLALHLFDPRTQQWSNYWASNRTGTLDPPVAGSFKNGVGAFYGVDVDGGQRVRVRHLWSDITATSVKWEQAFSIAEGETWETNAVFQMTRIDSEQPA